MSSLRRMVLALAYWTLPPGVQALVHRARFCTPGAKHYREEIVPEFGTKTALKNRHRDERCFILATGPSINVQNLSGLEGELCIAVSHFFLHRDIKKIAPRYHVLAPYHPPFTFADLDKLFDGFDQAYPADTTYIFGHMPYEFSVYNYLRKHSERQQDNVYFIDYTHSQPLDEGNYLDPGSWDLERSPFQVRTVIYTAIQLAAYMGCREIYLLGCDHDYLLDTRRFTNHHFYREEDGVSDVEHLSSFTTERWFEEYYFRWKQYRLMREYLKIKDCAIYNATHGGMLDVFPRRPLQDVVEVKSGVNLGVVQ